MKITIENNSVDLGKVAGQEAANLINTAIKEKGEANIILATGASQFETLNQLISEEVDWSKVTMFHLDEYIGMPETHKASFRKYLKERFLEKVSPLKAAHLVNGENHSEEECERLESLIFKHPIDVALVGIGENGHLAFNDPPADFDTEKAYLVVDLDEKCRLQQLGEGWFKTIDDVPSQAISMGIRQIMKSKHIICSVPDKRKAQAVKDSVENEISNTYPASILQKHASCHFYLDKESASLLSPDMISAL